MNTIHNTIPCPQPPAPAAAGLADVVRGAVEPRAPALAAGPGLAAAGGEGRGPRPPGPRHPLGRCVVVNDSHQRIYEDTITNWLLNTRSRLLFSEYCCKISLCCDTFISLPHLMLYIILSMLYIIYCLCCILSCL